MKLAFSSSLFILFLFVASCKNNVKDMEAVINELEIAETQLRELQSNKPGFVHTVFFWMKESVSEQQKKEFLDIGLSDLGEVSSLAGYYYGPSAQTPREVVDNSYDFALNCLFVNKEDHDKYQDDPIHLTFIDKYKDLWEKVVVYDNLVSN